MTLGEAQRLHVKCFANLLNWGFKNGYEFTWGESLRTQAQAVANAASGAGIAHSLHLLKLAVDINAFKGGVFLTHVEDYRPLGDYWKAQNPLCCWGGDFKKMLNGVEVSNPDSDHFSITWNGIK